jgi:hypothetical protein
MEPEIFIPAIFFGFLAAVILVPVLAKERTKRSAHELISQAMARGQALDPALITQLTDNMLQEGDKARRSLGSGVILLALAGGFVAATFVGGGDHDMLVPAVLMGSIGAAFVLLAIVDYISRNRAA